MRRWWIELPFAGSCLSTSRLTITEPAAIQPLDTKAQMHSRLRLRHNQVSTFVGQNHCVILKMEFILYFFEKIFFRFVRLVRCIRLRSTITCDFDGSKNWGDSLTPVIIERLTGRKCQKPCFKFQDRFFVIGSILERVDARSFVYGAGFMYDHSSPKGVPKEIFAVRGPLSRQIFLAHDISCPPVYGDPAILLGDFYPREKLNEKKYGIIPHYIDKNNNWVSRQLIKFKHEVLLIDIEGGIEYVINEVVRCEYIISSSLHGLICADVYGIPNIRVVLSNLVQGGDFKFHDYRLGVGCKPHKVIDPNRLDLNLPDLIKYSSLANIDKAKADILENNPFK